MTKNKLIYIYLYCILCLDSCFLFSQSIDDLKLALKNAKHDTTRCKILSNLTDVETDDAIWPLYNERFRNIAEKNLHSIDSTHTLYPLYMMYAGRALNNKAVFLAENGNFAEGISYFKKGLLINEKIKNVDGISVAVNGIGITLIDMGEQLKATDFLKQSYNRYETLFGKKEKAQIFTSLGMAGNFSGDIKKAIEYFGKSLQLREEINDRQDITNSLNNLGLIYKEQGDLNKALEYFQRSLIIGTELNDKDAMGHSLCRIGYIYMERQNFDSALYFLRWSFAVRHEIDNHNGMAESLAGIGGVYFHMGLSEKAEEAFLKSLAIRENIQDLQGAANTLFTLGQLYFRKKEYTKADQYGMRSLALAQKLGFPDYIKDAANLLASVKKQSGNYGKALEYYELYITMRDSMTNDETKRASVKSQLKYEYEKKMATDSVEHAKETEIKKVQIEKQESELIAKKNEQYALFGGLGLVLVFAGFMYNRYRLTQKQKKIIEEQKLLVEEKQSEILDSIHYARRIQNAMITNEKYIHKSLNKHKY